MEMARQSQRCWFTEFIWDHGCVLVSGSGPLINKEWRWDLHQVAAEAHYFLSSEFPLPSGCSTCYWQTPDLLDCFRKMNQVPFTAWLCDIQLGQGIMPTSFSQKVYFNRLVNENENLFSTSCFFIIVSSIQALNQEWEAWFEIFGRIWEEEMIHLLWGKGKLFRQINPKQSKDSREIQDKCLRTSSCMPEPRPSPYLVLLFSFWM